MHRHDWYRKPAPGSGLDFWALSEEPRVRGSQACQDHWVNDINANGRNEFRMTLNLGLLVRGPLVIPNWYLSFAITNRIAVYEKMACVQDPRVQFWSDYLLETITVINSEFLISLSQTNGVCVGQWHPVWKGEERSF